MVTQVKDIVRQAYTAEDGLQVATVIRKAFENGKTITLSFDGIRDVPSSFINGAFVSLLRDYPITTVKRDLRVISATRQTVEMIRRCFDNAERHGLAA